MARRVFVIRDFEIGGIEISLEDVRREPPEGCEELIVPGLSGGRTQGQIFDDAVRRELMRASHVLAFVDLPNANVGFEIGYALGLGKAVALARVAARLPPWLAEPPLAGYLAPAVRNAEELRGLIQGEHWVELSVKQTPGTGVLFMCPESGEGASLHRMRTRRQPSWEVLPSAGWSLLDLSRKLDGIGRVVWCIVPYARDTDERDGRENAADAIVAGFASACGLELTVLRHAQARPVADLQQWEHRFSRLEEFERLLALAPMKSTAPPVPAETPLHAPVPPGRPHAPEVSVTPSRKRGWTAGLVAACLVAAALLLAAAWIAAGSVSVLRLAAEHGVTSAQFRLAVRLQEGDGGDAAKEAEALKWLQSSANSEHGPALMRLGGMYEKGIGVRRDANRARGYFHRAAKLGNFEARGREGSLLGQQLGDGTQSPEVVTSSESAASVASAASRAVASSEKDKRWTNGSTLTVSFMGGTAQDHEQVKRYVKQWATYANINFVFKEAGAKTHVRIAFDSLRGNWSFLGTDNLNVPPEQPTMNIGSVDEPSVLHEFGHLLGLLHEHQNPKANIEWNWERMRKESGWDKATLDFNVRPYKPADYVIPKPFDPYSVMLFTFPAEWTNGIVLNQGQSLSTTDKAYIARLYPGRSTTAK